MTIDANGAIHATATGRFTGVTHNEGEPELLGQPAGRKTPKRGMTFTHHSFLDTDWQPGPGQRYVDAPKRRMVITRVDRRTVWYGHAADEKPKAAWREARAVFEEEYGAELEG